MTAATESLPTTPAALPEPQPESRPRRVRSDQLLLAVMALVVLGAWLYIVLRAVRVPFTTDEAGSYAILHGNHGLARTANNQWLNTALMRASESLFGQAEWALRLPNVLAFGLYGAAGMVILSQLRSGAVRVVGFLLLFGDPFLLEFFGLARGYGLCLAFSAAALALLLYRRGTPSGWQSVGRLLAIGLAANLAFYANFAAVNLIIAIIAVAWVDVVARALARQVFLGGRELSAAIAVMFATGAGMVPGLAQIRHLQAAGQLYYGGQEGFVRDTVGSLLQTWRYWYNFFAPTWADVTVVVAVVIVVGWAAGRFADRRSWSGAQSAALVLVIAILAAVGESTLLGTRSPTDRIALIYVLAFAAALPFALDDLVVAGGSRLLAAPLAIVAGCAAVLAASNFKHHANLSTTVTWAFDAPSHRVINDLMALRRQSAAPPRRWTLVTELPLNYSVDYYYRRRLGLSWLTTYAVGSPAERRGDFYYVRQADARKLPPGARLLRTYASGGTQLWSGARP